MIPVIIELALFNPLGGAFGRFFSAEGNRGIAGQNRGTYARVV
jgi:hypothetical protein